MQASSEAKYRHVQGLSRGLAILRALNGSADGEATPRQLSERTKLNRSTVKRLLETLAEEGYVRASPCDGRYAVAPDVSLLCRGMTEEARVLSHGMGAMQRLGRETGWSLRITTPHLDRMVIRDSTHPWSNLASEPWGGLRHALPILLTAAGRAYFANCSLVDRSRIVDEACSHRDEQSPVANNRKLVETITRRVLDDGYGFNDGDWGQRKIGAVAVPIHDRDGRAVASLSMLYARAEVGRADIDGEFVPALRRCVAGIEAMN